MIQSGLYKVLKGRLIIENNNTSVTSETSSISIMSNENWKDLDLRVASAIHLCLTNNVLVNVHEILTTKELWEKLKELYQTNGVSNQVYLNEQFHTLQINECMTISLSSTYEHMKLILIYRKEKIIFSKVTIKIFSKKRRPSGRSNSLTENLAMVAPKNGKMNNFIKKKIYCGCGQSRYVKKNYQRCGLGLTSGSKSVNWDSGNDTNIVSLP